MLLQEIKPIYKVILYLKAGQIIELLMDNRPKIDFAVAINLQGCDPRQSPEVKTKEIGVQADEVSAYEIIDDPKGI